jgi:hypothetical protein
MCDQRALSHMTVLPPARVYTHGARSWDEEHGDAVAGACAEGLGSLVKT